MSTPTMAEARVATEVRTAGWLCLVAGVLGVASGIYLAVLEPAVDEACQQAACLTDR